MTADEVVDAGGAADTAAEDGHRGSGQDSRRRDSAAQETGAEGEATGDDVEAEAPEADAEAAGDES